MKLKDTLRYYYIILTTWEYWPWGIIYGPIYIYYLFNVLRSGKWFYFSAVNSAMYNGGFFANDKTEMYNLLPNNSFPKYMLVGAKQDISSLLITYPIFVKPNQGERGFRIKKIHHYSELQEYHSKSSCDYLIQEFCTYSEELSVFCIFDPHKNNFTTSSIVGKHLLKVKGDGISTLYQLICKDNRAFIQLRRLENYWQKQFNHVLKKDETIDLIDNANHSKGACFYLIEEQQEKISAIFTTISAGIEGFNYGRFDIKYNSIEGLLRGEYSIIELNGVGAEPIDMYIPNLPLHRGLSILLYHWKKMFEIAMYNIKIRKTTCLSKEEGFKLLRNYRRYKGTEMW